MQYSQTISKENFFHMILLMFQESDTMRDKTITVICKMMKKTQSQDWFEILKREFYFVPIGRGNFNLPNPKMKLTDT
jgi:type IV secretory pathway TrbL component